MSILIKDHELLQKYNEIWEKVINNIKKEFHGEPVYNGKYLKTKIKSYNKKKSPQMFTIIRYQKKVLNLFCLSVILIDSVFRMGTM